MKTKKKIHHMTANNKKSWASKDAPIDYLKTTDLSANHSIEKMYSKKKYNKLTAEDLKKPLHSLCNNKERVSRLLFAPRDEVTSKVDNMIELAISNNTKRTNSSELLYETNEILDNYLENKRETTTSTTANHTDQSKNTMSMQNLEQILVETGKFHAIYNQLYFYNGIYHQAVGNENELLRLMRSILDRNVLDKIPNIGRFRDVFCYLSANPDITINISPDFERKYKNFITFDNLIFDATTGKTKKHNAKWPLISQVLCDFTPDDMSCPNFERFLDDISDGDPDVCDLICEVIGYLMMHNSSLKKFFLFAPAQDTGKSVLGDFIASLFPTDNTFRVQLSDFNRNFSMGSLGRRTLGMGMDLQPGIINDAAVTRLKLLTGEKLIDTEEKYQPLTTSYNHCKFLFASNHPLELSHPDDAFWSRLVLVPFVKPIDPEHRNYDLPELLQEEKSAIATKCAFAAQRLVENNYQFTQPQSAIRIINSWRKREYDPLVTFVHQECVVTNSPEDYISSQDLYDHYQNFCLQNGFTYVPQKTFSLRIKELFNLCSSKKRCGNDMRSLNVICGIKFKN